MNTILPNRRYSFEEMETLRADPEVARKALEGYVLRQNLDGTLSFVHWSKATGGGGAFGGKSEPTRGFASTWDTNEGPGPWGDLPAIRKRTPQQRVDSLMLKFIEDCKRTGTVPGLDDERISAIVGQAWKTGRSEITAEVVKKVAQHFLTEAERTP